MSLVPTLPPQSIYTSCYCEENIYLLCQNLLHDSTLKEEWEVCVVFISNVNKTESAFVIQVALWFQNAALSGDHPVVWDYHVILVLRPRKGEKDSDAVATPLEGFHSWVYDFDTRLALPCPWQEYFNITVPEGILPAYKSQFRVIKGESFLQNFASDRSHMLLSPSLSRKAEPVYLSPPPAYPPICGPSALQKGIANNLMERYVAMVESTDEAADGDFYGEIFDKDEVDLFFSDHE